MNIYCVLGLLNLQDLLLAVSSHDCQPDHRAELLSCSGLGTREVEIWMVTAFRETYGTATL